jgi:hypothetical protein
MMLGLVPLGVDVFLAVAVAVALTWSVAVLVSRYHEKQTHSAKPAAAAFGC